VRVLDFGQRGDAMADAVTTADRHPEKSDRLHHPITIFGRLLAFQSPPAICSARKTQLLLGGSAQRFDRSQSAHVKSAPDRCATNVAILVNRPRI
jgi:hypothetical protein